MSDNDTYVEVDQFQSENSFEADDLIILIQKEHRTREEEEEAKRLVSTLFQEATVQDYAGEEALYGLGRVADACSGIGAYQTAAAFWSRIADIAEALGDKNFYYAAMEAMTKLTSATYEERHGGGKRAHA